MRTIGIACIIFVAMVLGANAEDKIGELITDYNVLTIYEIPGKYTDKPINLAMPSYWDGNMARVRIKAVYRNPTSLTGTSAVYLSPTMAPATLVAGHDGSPVIQIVVDESIGDVLYLHAVFRNKKETVCK